MALSAPSRRGRRWGLPDHPRLHDAALLLAIVFALLSHGPSCATALNTCEEITYCSECVYDSTNGLMPPELRCGWCASTQSCLELTDFVLDQYYVKQNHTFIDAFCPDLLEKSHMTAAGQQQQLGERRCPDMTCAGAYTTNNIYFCRGSNIALLVFALLLVVWNAVYLLWMRAIRQLPWRFEPWLSQHMAEEAPPPQQQHPRPNVEGSLGCLRAMRSVEERGDGPGAPPTTTPSAAELHALRNRMIRRGGVCPLCKCLQAATLGPGEVCHWCGIARLSFVPFFIGFWVSVICVMLLFSFAVKPWFSGYYFTLALILAYGLYALLAVMVLRERRWRVRRFPVEQYHIVPDDGRDTGDVVASQTRRGAGSRRGRGRRGTERVMTAQEYDQWCVWNEVQDRLQRTLYLHLAFAYLYGRRLERAFPSLGEAGGCDSVFRSVYCPGRTADVTVAAVEAETSARDDNGSRRASTTNRGTGSRRAGSRRGAGGEAPSGRPFLSEEEGPGPAAPSSELPVGASRPPPPPTPGVTAAAAAESSTNALIAATMAGTDGRRGFFLGSPFATAEQSLVLSRTVAQAGRERLGTSETAPLGSPALPPAPPPPPQSPLPPLQPQVSFQGQRNSLLHGVHTGGGALHTIPEHLLRQKRGETTQLLNTDILGGHRLRKSLQQTLYRDEVFLWYSKPKTYAVVQDNAWLLIDLFAGCLFGVWLLMLSSLEDERYAIVRLSGDTSVAVCGVFCILAFTLLLAMTVRGLSRLYLLTNERLLTMCEGILSPVINTTEVATVKHATMYGYPESRLRRLLCLHTEPALCFSWEVPSGQRRLPPIKSHNFQGITNVHEFLMYFRLVAPKRLSTAAAAAAGGGPGEAGVPGAPINTAMKHQRASWRLVMFITSALIVALPLMTVYPVAVPMGSSLFVFFVVLLVLLATFSRGLRVQQVTFAPLNLADEWIERISDEPTAAAAEAAMADSTLPRQRTDGGASTGAVDNDDGPRVTREDASGGPPGAALDGGPADGCVAGEERRFLHGGGSFEDGDDGGDATIETLHRRPAGAVAGADPIVDVEAGDDDSELVDQVVRFPEGDRDSSEGRDLRRGQTKLTVSSPLMSSPAVRERSAEGFYQLLNVVEERPRGTTCEDAEGQPQRVPSPQRAAAGAMASRSASSTSLSRVVAAASDDPPPLGTTWGSDVVSPHSRQSPRPPRE